MSQEFLNRLDRLDKQMAGMIEWRNKIDVGMEYRRFASPEIDKRLSAVESSRQDLDKAIGRLMDSQHTRRP